MRILRSVRLMLLALLVFSIPASSYAVVFISVGYAPPPLPIYVQPPCPQPGLMWAPGYWAYGPDGYYWVPGEWVPAPYVGALWTPGYWGWSSGLYIWHPGYWGRHVGYYGGVNYGFGYFGIGFVGGMWQGGIFNYNRAVMRVDTRYIHNTYVDRSIVNRYTVARNSRVAFSGGPGGIRHAPNRAELAAGRERHMGPTSFQTQRMNAAIRDRNAYFRNNHGRPQNMVGQRPVGREFRPGFEGRPMNQPQQRQEFRQQPQQGFRPQQQYRPQEQSRQPQYRAQPQSRPQQEYGRQERSPRGARPQPRSENRGGPRGESHGRNR